MALRWLLAGLASLGAALPATRAVQVKGAAKGSDTLDFVAGEKGLAIEEVVALAEGVTNEKFFYEPKELRDASVMFTGKMSVPREKILSFLDWCLHEEGFVELEHEVAGARVHSLVKLGAGANRGAQALKTSARIVERAELDSLSDRWTLVTTTWSAKNVPARELVTTLQLYFADSATEAIRNIEGTDQVVMTGCAANLAALCALADRIDAATGKDEGFIELRRLAERVHALEAEVAALKQPAKDAGK